MKRFVVICDGMADIADENNGGLTPLEAAHTPFMDALAANGRTGLLPTVPPGHYPGSETAILTILGYPPESLPSGRGPLEAAGLGLSFEYGSKEIGRYILKNSGYGLDTIRKKYPDVSFVPLSEVTGIAIPTADNNLPPSSEYLKFWSIDTQKAYTPFFSLHKELEPDSKGVIIGFVPLLKGMAKEIGLDWLSPEGTTGTPSTDFAAKGDAAVKAAETHDIIIIHIEACDYASHHFNHAQKIASIESIDHDIIAPIVGYAEKVDEEVVIAVMSDHPSLCSTGCHSSAPPPFLLWYKGINPDNSSTFSEKEAAKGNLKSIKEIYG